jgi:hypothetical protein
MDDHPGNRQNMHVVAIYDLKDDKQTLAGALAAVLNVTVFEALSRLRAPGSGPFIVGVFAEQERASALAGRLGSGGFSATVLSAERIGDEADWWVIRRFSLNEQDLQVESLDGRTRTVSYQDIDLILRGTGISSSTSIEKTKQRKFDAASAVLSGGLKMTKTAKTTREVTTEVREGFFTLYAADIPPLLFRENSLVYDSLGSSRGLSRSANFAQLAAEVRRRCPAARYDERLLSRAGLASLLGPSLSPEEHVAVATALLANVLRGK